MSKYKIVTKYGTVYEIDDHGCFLRSGNNKWNCPHNSWRCTGIAEQKPFGRWRFIDLETFIDLMDQGFTQWNWNNGSAKYTLTDEDHGTHRMHGNHKVHGISSAYRID